jgi:hypothetical protein
MTENRWVLDSGVPIVVSDGTFVGYVGSMIDVTDPKLAREALSSLSRKLMEAQEGERDWIARELHDEGVGFEPEATIRTRARNPGHRTGSPSMFLPRRWRFRPPAFSRNMPNR